MKFLPVLESISQSLNATFYREEKKYMESQGSFIHSTVYTLAYTYQQIDVKFEFEFGHQNIGTLTFELEEMPNNCEFSIKTKSGLWQLINPQKKPLIVTCKNVRLSNFTDKNKAFLAMNHRAKKDRFEPEIKAQNTIDTYEVSCFSILNSIIKN